MRLVVKSELCRYSSFLIITAIFLFIFIVFTGLGLPSECMIIKVMNRTLRYGLIMVTLFIAGKMISDFVLLKNRIYYKVVFPYKTFIAKTLTYLFMLSSLILFITFIFTKRMLAEENGILAPSNFSVDSNWIFVLIGKNIENYLAFVEIFMENIFLYFAIVFAGYQGKQLLNLSYQKANLVILAMEIAIYFVLYYSSRVLIKRFPFLNFGQFIENNEECFVFLNVPMFFLGLISIFLFSFFL